MRLGIFAMHVKFIFNFSFVNIIVKFNTSIVSNSFPSCGIICVGYNLDVYSNISDLHVLLANKKSKLKHFFINLHIALTISDLIII